jgi:hypothetical protein
MSSIQNAHARTDDRYSFNVFGDADRFAKFVKDNGLQARGHATIWHSQLASWVYKLTDPVDLVCHFFPYNTDFQSTSVLATYLLMSDVLTLWFADRGYQEPHHSSQHPVQGHIPM